LKSQKEEKAGGTSSRQCVFARARMMRLTRADAAVVIVGNGYRSARRRLLGSEEHDRERHSLMARVAKS
jgi:hypothetical protein